MAVDKFEVGKTYRSKYGSLNTIKEVRTEWRADGEHFYLTDTNGNSMGECTLDFWTLVDDKPQAKLQVGDYVRLPHIGTEEPLRITRIEDGWRAFFTKPNGEEDWLNTDNNMDKKVTEIPVSQAFDFSLGGNKIKGFSFNAVILDESEYKEGEKKMELKDIKAANLKEAKKQFDNERMNEEIAFAKQKLTQARNEVDRLDRDIKALEEEKKLWLEILAKF